MLIKFETDSYPTIIMFGDVGKKLIKFMGHSGTIPSAIHAEDVLAALHNLQHALKKEIDVTTDDNNQDDGEDHVSLDKRATPLIELLQSAEKNDEGVMWDVT